ncbi:MAG: CCA tRNA nucleotidyltransferase [Deltaproteobacteria bacterium]|nr:CCA tRNA nucleotidyltransferase [Deltaproteobacteria bacterium]
MHDLSRLVSSNPTLSAIEDLFSPETYLVGGCIRDMLRGQEPLDFDIVTFSDVGSFADKIARRFSSTAFWMDKTRGVVRISLKGKGITIDVCLPKGHDIVADLRKRDITINAMAYAVSACELIDPLDGLVDLGHGVIRIISEDSLRDDPARVVRCLRFSVVLGFPIAASTAALLKKYACKVATVSAERIKQEFMKALCDQNGSRFFTLMETTGVIKALFPDIIYQGKDISLKGLRSALFLARETDGLIYDAEILLPGSDRDLAQEVESKLSRAGLLRLAAFVFGIAPYRNTEELDKSAVLQAVNPEQGILIAREICSSLKVSSRAITLINSMYASQKLVHEILSQKDLPVRIVHLLCEKAFSCLPETLLLAWALKRSPHSGNKAFLKHVHLKEKIQEIWRYFVDIYQVQKQNQLIDGNDVIRSLGIAPGPMVGRLLLEVEAARAEGVVNSRQEAIDHLHVLARQIQICPDMKRST